MKVDLPRLGAVKPEQRQEEQGKGTSGSQARAGQPRRGHNPLAYFGPWLPSEGQRTLSWDRVAALTYPKEQVVPAPPQGEGIRLPSSHFREGRDTWDRSPKATLGQVFIPPGVPYLRCIR